MTENKNDKHITKSQIELLKQKYLKKNIPSHPTPPAKDPVPQTLPSAQTQYPKLVIEKKYSLEDYAKSPPKQPLEFQNSPTHKQIGLRAELEKNKPKPDQPIQEFSLRKFIEEKDEGGSSRPPKPKLEVQEFQANKFNPKDPFNLKIPFQYCLDSQTLPEQKDPEFEDEKHLKKDESVALNKDRAQESNQPSDRDMGQACRLWITNPRKALLYVYFRNSNVDSQQSHLKLSSENPQFPGIVQQLAQQFIFTNNQPLRDNQKQVVYNMALEYFCPSPSHLSDVLLISLIKMSPTYACIYVDEIIRKMGFYVQKIVELKKYILKQELDNFVKCVEERMESLRTEGHTFPDSTYIWLLILKPNSNYCNQILLVRTIDSQRDLFAIFSALYPEGKQYALSILYLKCIDALVPLFIKSGILEKVISHLNEIKIPEVLYQAIKSLKLKLIRASDTKKEKKKNEDDRGFTLFMNEKITKFKQALQNKISIKIKPEVHFDSATGRYQPVVASPSSK